MDTKSKGRSFRNFAVKHIVLFTIILVGLAWVSSAVYTNSHGYNGKPYHVRTYADTMAKIDNFYNSAYNSNLELYRSTDYLKTIEGSNVTRINQQLGNTYGIKGINYLVYNSAKGQIISNSERALREIGDGFGINDIEKFIQNDAYGNCIERCNLSNSIADQYNVEYDDNGNPKEITENKHSKYIKNANNYDGFFWISKDEIKPGGVFETISIEEAKNNKIYNLHLTALAGIASVALIIILWLLIGERSVLKNSIQKLFIYKWLVLLFMWSKNVFFEVFTKKGLALKALVIATLVIIGVFFGALSGTIHRVEFMFLVFLVAIVCLVYMINLSIDLRKIEEYAKDSSATGFNGNVRSHNLKELAKDIEGLKLGYSDAVNDRIKNERLKAELVTNISHDLKTPLTSIINYTDIIMNRDITDSEREDYIRVLNSKGLKLKKLIDDLFEISKITSGKAQINLAKVNLVEIINQTLGELSTNIESSGIEFVVSYSSNDIQLNLDGNKISRVFENLITNVTKYSLNGTRGYIDVVEGDTNVEFIIKNISKDKLNMSDGEFFERFSRGDRARNSSTEGNGLGLSIAKSIVDAHGGNIQVIVDGDLFKVIVTFVK
ncbi:MAG: HAMP domain-containing sensor histidine kinase [Clostridium sp.]